MMFANLLEDKSCLKLSPHISVSQTVPYVARMRVCLYSDMEQQMDLANIWSYTRRLGSQQDYPIYLLLNIKLHSLN